MSRLFNSLNRGKLEPARRFLAKMKQWVTEPPLPGTQGGQYYAI